MRRIPLRVQLFELRHFRQVVDDDVGVVGVLGQEVLVVVLRWVKTTVALDGGHYRCVEGMGRVQLGDVGLGDLLLPGIFHEQCRTILGAPVGPLAIEFRGVMSHRKIDLQQAAVADLGRVEGHSHRLGVAGIAFADTFVLRGFGRAPGVARHRTGHPFDMLEHPLHAPETTTGEHRGFTRRIRHFVDHWRCQDDRLFARAQGKTQALPDHAGERQAEQGVTPGQSAIHGKYS